MFIIFLVKNWVYKGIHYSMLNKTKIELNDLFFIIDWTAEH